MRGGFAGTVTGRNPWSGQIPTGLIQFVHVRETNFWLKWQESEGRMMEGRMTASFRIIYNDIITRAVAFGQRCRGPRASADTQSQTCDE
jgi:hypothetical protein